MDAPDVVVLVPGFLGFSRFGGFYYFADRLVAVLRVLLEEETQQSVPVVPCTVLPTSSLATRQGHLLRYLYRLCTEQVGAVERLHVVGHSTGGVDAQLLACTTRVDGTPWSDEEQEVLAHLRTVVTISAPHHGTGLANARLARFAESPLRDPFAPLTAGRLFFDLGMLAVRDLAALAGLQAARIDDVAQFLGHIAFSRALVHDLRPASMAAVRARVTPRADVRVTCFASGTVLADGGARPSEPFFRDLYRMTADGETEAAPEPLRARLRAAAQDPSRVIASAAVPSADACADMNDGVVNTARQLLDGADLGALVIADHADVLGHYDRQDDLVEGHSYNAGLFHSGAGFGDAQFYTLYRRVARVIASRMPGASAVTEAVSA